MCGSVAVTRSAFFFSGNLCTFGNTKSDRSFTQWSTIANTVQKTCDFRQNSVGPSLA